MGSTAPFHGPTCLYRLFDKNSTLLYVGISNTPKERWKQHAADKPWWPLVATRGEEWYLERRDAEKAERVAREVEKPRFNSITPAGETESNDRIPKEEIEAAGRRVAERLAEDIEAGIFTSDKLLPSRPILAARYDESEWAVATALWHLERQKVLTRATGNRHIVASGENFTDITSRDLMLREIQRHFHNNPFTCADLHTATGRSNYVIRLNAERLVDEGRLREVPRPAGTVGRYVRHWALPAPRAEA
ncbi:GIY-YIG nuclease family protein [Streptomyces zaomyceticus]|uniref:GIY-YIG nuclease family protein n=1 Tax=Streptomyces zaomyceticus TaxID=68286 RepID=UPI0033BD82E8